MAIYVEDFNKNKWGQVLLRHNIYIDKDSIYQDEKDACIISGTSYSWDNNICPCHIILNCIKHGEFRFNDGYPEEDSFIGEAMKVRIFSNNKWVDYWYRSDDFISDSSELTWQIDQAFLDYQHSREQKKLLYSNKNK